MNNIVFTKRVTVYFEGTSRNFEVGEEIYAGSGKVTSIICDLTEKWVFIKYGRYKRLYSGMKFVIED